MKRRVVSTQIDGEPERSQLRVPVWAQVPAPDLTDLSLAHPSALAACGAAGFRHA
jgi:hypothetical protein